MQTLISSWCCAAVMVAITCQSDLKAQENEGEDPEPICTKEELMTFFPRQIVENVLVRFQVPQEQAVAIAEELAAQNQGLLQKVEEKAAKLDPNPFKDLSQRDAAIKIYQETLHEVFTQVLKAHQIDQEAQIDLYLNEIRRIKSKLFVECIRKQQQHHGLSGPPPLS